MSWSIQAIETDVDTVEDDLANATIYGQDAELWHVGHAVEEAKRAAIELVKRGGVGSGRVRVVLTGHANPDHKPLPPWVNDCITVTISQV